MPSSKNFSHFEGYKIPVPFRPLLKYLPNCHVDRAAPTINVIAGPFSSSEHAAALKIIAELSRAGKPLYITYTRTRINICEDLSSEILKTEDNSPLGPKRPLLRYFGGKWKMAPRIIPLLPPHTTYIEPFGGAASVLLRKHPSKHEIYNDLNSEVVNLFQVLRHHGEALYQLLSLTPYSREEFRQSASMDHVDPIERARRTVIRSNMAHASVGLLRSRAAFRKQDSRDSYAKDWVTYTDALPAIISRLRNVVIENLDALALIQKYDSPDTLLYIDPPYVMNIRKDSRKGYQHELTNEQHEELIKTILSLKHAYVALSTYETPLYEKAFSSWKKHTFQTTAMCKTARTEVLYLSPNQPAQMFPFMN